MNIDPSRPDLYQHVNGTLIEKMEVKMNRPFENPAFPLCVKFANGEVGHYSLDGCDVGRQSPSIVLRSSVRASTSDCANVGVFERTIDWNDKESLRRRGAQSARAIEVCIIPSWATPGPKLHYVLWSDRFVTSHYLDGAFREDREWDDCDVILPPREVVGWIYKSALDGKSGYIFSTEQMGGTANEGPHYVKVKLTEIIE